MKRSRREMEQTELRLAIEELSSSSSSSSFSEVKKPCIIDNNNNNKQVEDEKASSPHIMIIIIPTRPFLSVCNLLLQLLDKIGPRMIVLRQDVDENMKRLECNSNTNIQEILNKEKLEGSARNRNSCSRACVWLTRAIDFGVKLIQQLAKDPQKSMEQAVQETYSVTLKPWHGWISSAAYKVALKIMPDRKTFISLLNKDLEEMEVQTLISLLVPFLHDIFSILRVYGLDNVKSP